jgi:hypothetical protein
MGPSGRGKKSEQERAQPRAPKLGSNHHNPSQKRECHPERSIRIVAPKPSGSLGEPLLLAGVTLGRNKQLKRESKDLRFARQIRLGMRAAPRAGPSLIPREHIRREHIHDTHLVPRKRDYGRSHGLQAVEKSQNKKGLQPRALKLGSNHHNPSQKRECHPERSIRIVAPKPSGSPASRFCSLG